MRQPHLSSQASPYQEIMRFKRRRMEPIIKVKTIEMFVDMECLLRPVIPKLGLEGNQVSVKANIRINYSSTRFRLRDTAGLCSA